MKVVCGLVAALAVVAGISAGCRDSDRQLQVVAGRTTISFYPSLLQSDRLKLSVNPSADGDANSAEQTSGFAIKGSDLTFTVVNGQFTRFDSGELPHEGGFVLSSGRNSIDANNFTIAPTRNATDSVVFRVGTGKSAFVPFEFKHARTYFDWETNVLGVVQMDVVMTYEGAQRLRRPELEGSAVGTLSVYADAQPCDGGGKIIVTDPADGTSSANRVGLDVSLSAMALLQSAGRLGTFPNGRNGLTMSTTSCNVGTLNIPWYAPMDVRHPVIAMNLYRVSNGRFEQVGWSWLKHGFLAVNANQCGTCNQPGTSALLGVNCSDTYGTGNNSDRFYLGGRDEVNAFTGVWTCQNSYFSNYQNDCVRRNTGSEFGSDPVAHRLEVLDADLGVAGAQYYYEAYYISASDIDKYNNIGSRGASMTWGGSSWSFTTTSAMVSGPAINRWGEMRSTAQPQTEGDVIVGVQTTNLGGGMWRYEYAVYNHDSDRQIREFSVPLPNGSTVQNVGFHDIDQVGTNQWASTVANNKITWSTGTFGVGTPNPLKYSSTFNFRFDCNVQPVDSSATLGLFKPGTGTELKASTKAPLMLQPVSSFNVEVGLVQSGNLASLASSDNNSLQLLPLISRNGAGSGLRTSMTGPAGAVGKMYVGVESRNTVPARTTPVQTIQLWNWTTGGWELIDTRTTTPNDTQAVIAITSNTARFIEGTTREVRARVLHSAGNGSLGGLYFDQVGVQFN